MPDRPPVADELAALLLNRRHPALGIFLPAGLTSASVERQTLDTLVCHGADLIEVGFPVGNPVLDGPAITAAYHRALHRGTDLPDVLCTVESAASKAPVVVMAYWDAVVRHSPSLLAREIKAAGAMGMMIVDLPAPHAASWHSAAANCGLATPCLVSRNSRQRQLPAVCSSASGWLYAPASEAPTGYQGPLDITALSSFTQRLRSASPLPVVSGVGISTPERAALVAPLVDGVIVGTPVVRALAGGRTQEVATLVANFATAIRTAGEGTNHD
ncbi:tryptophan synthase subunit alpha [Streptomyces sp. NPDC001739]